MKCNFVTRLVVGLVKVWVLIRLSTKNRSCERRRKVAINFTLKRGEDYRPARWGERGEKGLSSRQHAECVSAYGQMVQLFLSLYIAWYSLQPLLLLGGGAVRSSQSCFCIGLFMWLICLFIWDEANVCTSEQHGRGPGNESSNYRWLKHKRCREQSRQCSVILQRGSELQSCESQPLHPPS